MADVILSHRTGDGDVDMDRRELSFNPDVRAQASHGRIMVVREGIGLRGSEVSTFLETLAHQPRNTVVTAGCVRETASDKMMAVNGEGLWIPGVAEAGARMGMQGPTPRDRQAAWLGTSTRARGNHGAT